MKHFVLTIAFALLALSMVLAATPKPLPHPSPVISVVTQPTVADLKVMWQNSPSAQFYNQLSVDAGSNIVLMAVIATDRQDPVTATALAQAINDASVKGVDAVYALAVPVVPEDNIDGRSIRLSVQGQCRSDPTPVVPVEPVVP